MNNPLITFCKRLICGMIILTLLLMASFYLLIAISSRLKQFELSESTSVLVLGNSRPECAINDGLISNTKNLARSAEPIYYTLVKLKCMLEWNPQIKTVYVELSENQLESRMSEWIWSKESVERHVGTFLPYLPIHYHFEAFRKHKLDYLHDLFIGARKLTSALLLGKGNDYFNLLQWGGFNPQTGCHVDSEKSDNYLGKEEVLLPNEDNLKAINDMIFLCQEKKVNLVFIRCPTLSKLHMKFERSFQNFLKANKHISCRSFHDLKLPLDCFYDDQHLNGQGAAIFTQQYFSKIIGQR